MAIDDVWWARCWARVVKSWSDADRFETVRFTGFPLAWIGAVASTSFVILPSCLAAWLIAGGARPICEFLAIELKQSYAMLRLSTTVTSAGAI